jgi:intron-binding protein aquarius
MINEKFRERVYAWECFTSTDKDAEFADFFRNVLLLCVDKFKSRENKFEYASFQEYSILVKFLDNCVNSLEVDLVRAQIQKICNLAMWHSLSDNRRDYELKRFSKLKKFWKAIEKNDAKLSETEREALHFERLFLKSLIMKFLKVVYSLNTSKSDDGYTTMEIDFGEDKEMGEIDDDVQDTPSLNKFKINFLNRCLELLIDLEALLPTRRFFNTLIDDTNILIHCQLSDLIKEGKNQDGSANNDSQFNDRNLFSQLFDMLK